MDLSIILENYTTHKACIKHLEKIRWGSIPQCTYCYSKRSSPVEKENRHKCRDCNNSYSVLVGTIFESSKLPLHKWFIALYLIMDAKKGISSLQLSRHLNINKDTAWFLQRKIRAAMSETNLLEGIIEIDETYIGGGLTKMNHKQKRNEEYNKSGMEHKQPVLGMYQRNGKIILRHLNKAWGEEIKPILSYHISKESTVITDGFGGYFGIAKNYKDHIILNHSKKIYNIGSYNMSSLEGFWSMVKRAVIGTYHKISVKYLQEYLDELAFKYNYKDNKNRYEILLNNLLFNKFPLSG